MKENIKHYWCDSRWQRDNIKFLAPNNQDLADLLMADDKLSQYVSNKALDLYMLGGGLPVYHYTKKNLDFCLFCFWSSSKVWL